eukprot:scaffold21774_cov18-Tisochrysis_lutea.AAC.3
MQAGLHEQYGGVKPDVARDAHAAAICSTVDGCLQDAGISAADLTAVAVTVGPGLSLCLQAESGLGFSAHMNLCQQQLMQRQCSVVCVRTEEWRVGCAKKLQTARLTCRLCSTLIWTIPCFVYFL